MKPLIIALDVETEKEAVSIIRATRKFVDLYKVGPGLLMRYGPAIVKKITGLRRQVFLDLKFHDIPSTVARSVREALKIGVYSVTLHTSAGEKALKLAADVKPRPKLWGVTVLTSMTDHDLASLGLAATAQDQVMRLAGIARQAGIDGVVASVGETSSIRKLAGNSFTIVTPGIRLPEDAVGDQMRVATPQHARAAGASFIVVGRPIIESDDPGLFAERVMRDWNKKVNN